MKVQEPSKKKEIIESEFKASLWHSVWLGRMGANGHHSPDKHRKDRYNVCPPLRDDQKFCDKCNFEMIEYDLLPEKIKEVYRQTVRDAETIQNSWEEVKR